MLMQRFAQPFYFLTCLITGPEAPEYNGYYRSNGGYFLAQEVLVRVNMWTGLAQMWQPTRISWSSHITYHNLSKNASELMPFYGPLPEHFYYQEA